MRFVNQPEVVERFVTLEKEIVQIENSIQSNESTNGNGLHQSQCTRFSPSLPSFTNLSLSTDCDFASFQYKKPKT